MIGLSIVVATLPQIIVLVQSSCKKTVSYKRLCSLLLYGLGVAMIALVIMVWEMFMSQETRPSSLLTLAFVLSLGSFLLLLALWAGTSPPQSSKKVSETYRTPRNLEEAAEVSTGMSVQEIRETPLLELRRKSEKKYGGPAQIVYGYPEGKPVSHQEIEDSLDKALKKKA